MVYYQKDSRPRKVFTSDQLIPATCAQTLSTQFLSWPTFSPPVNFADLRSQLLIVHTLLFSKQYKTLSTSLLSNKLYPDHTRARARKNRICQALSVG